MPRDSPLTKGVAFGGQVEQLDHVGHDLLAAEARNLVGQGEKVQNSQTFMPSYTPKLSGM